jgi:hypothetical protein
LTHLGPTLYKILFSYTKQDIVTNADFLVRSK